MTCSDRPLHPPLHDRAIQQLRQLLSDTDSIEKAHTRIPSNSVKGVTIILFGVEVENECKWYIDDCGLYLCVDNEIKCREDKDAEMGCLRGICMEDVKNII